MEKIRLPLNFYDTKWARLRTEQFQRQGGMEFYSNDRGVEGRMLSPAMFLLCNETGAEKEHGLELPTDRLFAAYCEGYKDGETFFYRYFDYVPEKMDMEQWAGSIAHNYYHTIYKGRWSNLSTIRVGGAG